MSAVPPRERVLVGTEPRPRSPLRLAHAGSTDPGQDPAPRGRLAVFVPNLAAGGAERAALKLAGGLAARGFDVDLVLAAATGPRVHEIPPEVRVVDLRARRVLTGLPALVRYLRRERPDAIASFLDHGNVVALCARRLARYPGTVVVVAQNTLSEAARHGKSRRDRLMPRLVTRCYPWADRVVAVSAGVAADLVRIARLPPEHVRVISNPIVDDDLAALAARPVDHPWFRDGVGVFVAAGRLRPQKDFATLLHAFARLRERRRARLLILGEGPERPALEALVARLGLEADVSLPGSTTNPYGFFSRATAFVLSSRWEGLPTVLVEAMSCGAPAIATDCPSGPREILAGGRHGALVPIGDAGALASAMERALDGELPRPAPESWQPYTLDAVVDDYLPLLTSAAARRPARLPARAGLRPHQ
jgi:glycosyltransferase involved in cell wall biosynthesis